MAITTQNVAFDGQGPAVTGQVLVQGTLPGSGGRFLIGTATFTGDGATTSATLNYIDGTNVLGFAPTAVFAARVGGSDTAAGVPYVVDNANNGLSATINWTVAIANTKTQTVAVFIQK